MAMPPGPVTVAILKVILDKGARQAILMATGTGFMDLVYCLAAVYATEAVEALIGNFFENHPIILFVFQILVIIAFIIFGLITIFNKEFLKRREEPKESRISKSKFINTLRVSGPFFLGIAIAFANLANPSFLVSIAISATQAKKILIDMGFQYSALFYSVGFGLGNFLWLALISKLIDKYQEKLSDVMFERARQIAGAVFIIAGILLGYYVVVATKWNNFF